MIRILMCWKAIRMCLNPSFVGVIYDRFICFKTLFTRGPSTINKYLMKFNIVHRYLEHAKHGK